MALWEWQKPPFSSVYQTLVQIVIFGGGAFFGGIFLAVALAALGWISL